MRHPANAAEAAIARLLAAGRKVAVSEQPAGERPLRRVTPGTPVDAAVLAAGRPNIIAQPSHGPRQLRWQGP